MDSQRLSPGSAAWRRRLHEVIFEADTPAGRTFDVLLLLAIVVSILAVALESVETLRVRWGGALRAAEWTFTVLFTLEYGLRIVSVRRPFHYVTSFFGVVDLLSILPTYLSVLFPGAQSFLVIRAFRLLRVFRVLKLARYLGEASVLKRAIAASLPKITVFLGTVLTIDLIFGTVMYLVEGAAHGFDNIPRSVYWAVVTMTTVGYGDISPGTGLGRFIAGTLMILGYGIIAVPTGIVSVELGQAQRQAVSTQVCPNCALEGHDLDARHCKRCGAAL